MDVTRAEQLFGILAEVTDQPLYEDSARAELSATLAITALEIARSVRILCAADQLLGATVCLRSQFESLVRSVWTLHCASEHEIRRLSTNSLTPETAQGAKNIPLAAQMLEDLEEIPSLKNLMVALNEFKASAWRPLNSFVHAGLHAVIHTKFGWPQDLVGQTFRMSNGLCLLAFTQIGLLNGTPGIQGEIIALAASFSSVLPKYRDST
ncbi:hypothetical protein H6G99_07275 [Synechococcus sp. FACHB-909]|nr:hypothetical protein [Synechococcus sp. FACHB-909]